MSETAPGARDGLGVWCGWVLTGVAVLTPLFAWLGPLGFAPLLGLAGLLCLPAFRVTMREAPLLVILSYVIGPVPMSLQFWPGAIVMMLIATMAATLMTNGGRSAWFVGVMILMVHAIFAMTLFLLPPAA